jgi:pyruvate/2-oxoglutarate/acetoin dehydrogenase E1 component
MPSTPGDAKGLLKSAIRDDNPVFFIEHKLLYNEKGLVSKDDYLIPIGVPEVKRAGKDVTIVAYSRQLLFALKAADELAKVGIECEVVDLRTLIPLNLGIVEESVKKTGRLVTCEEGPITGGVGAEISARVSRDLFDYLDAPVERVAALDTPIPFARNLEKTVIPQPEHIIEAVKRILS